jgi:hypothetical protein
VADSLFLLYLRTGDDRVSLYCRGHFAYSTHREQNDLKLGIFCNELTDELDEFRSNSIPAPDPGVKGWDPPMEIFVAARRARRISTMELARIKRCTH